jgi:hypothetical protein
VCIHIGWSSMHQSSTYSKPASLSRSRVRGLRAIHEPSQPRGRRASCRAICSVTSEISALI